MTQLFITPIKQVAGALVRGVPRSKVVGTVAEALAQELGSNASVWLDAGASEMEQRPKLLRDAMTIGRPVVFMAATPNEWEALQALNNGAQGYCHKLAAPRQLRQISHVVLNGGVWLMPRLMQRFGFVLRVVPTSEKAEAVGSALDELTSREVMVAKLVGRGESNREIAAELEITERTVKAHLSAIFTKLGVRDRVQLALTVDRSIGD